MTARERPPPRRPRRRRRVLAALARPSRASCSAASPGSASTSCCARTGSSVCARAPDGGGSRRSSSRTAARWNRSSPRSGRSRRRRATGPRPRGACRPTRRWAAARPCAGLGTGATETGWPASPGRTPRVSSVDAGGLPATHAARGPHAAPDPPDRQRAVVVLVRRPRALRPGRHRPGRLLPGGAAAGGVGGGVPQADAARGSRRAAAVPAVGPAGPAICGWPT